MSLNKYEQKLALCLSRYKITATQYYTQLRRLGAHLSLTFSDIISDIVDYEYTGGNGIGGGNLDSFYLSAEQLGTSLQQQSFSVTYHYSDNTSLVASHSWIPGDSPISISRGDAEIYLIGLTITLNNPEPFDANEGPSLGYSIFKDGNDETGSWVLADNVLYKTVSPSEDLGDIVIRFNNFENCKFTVQTVVNGGNYFVRIPPIYGQYVNWGDGEQNQLNEHNYSTPGQYQLSLHIPRNLNASMNFDGTDNLFLNLISIDKYLDNMAQLSIANYGNPYEFTKEQWEQVVIDLDTNTPNGLTAIYARNNGFSSTQLTQEYHDAQYNLYNKGIRIYSTDNPQSLNNLVLSLDTNNNTTLLIDFDDYYNLQNYLTYHFQVYEDGIATIATGTPLIGIMSLGDTTPGHSYYVEAYINDSGTHTNTQTSNTIVT